MDPPLVSWTDQQMGEPLASQMDGLMVARMGQPSASVTEFLTVLQKDSSKVLKMKQPWASQMESLTTSLRD